MSGHLSFKEESEIINKQDKNKKSYKDLKIPWARNIDGELINIEDAIKGKEYFCPCCSERLTFRSGKIKKRHFSHKTDTECDPESLYHKLAKILICFAIEQNAKGNRTIKLRNICFGCDKEHEQIISKGYFSHGEVEVQIGKYRCDVVGYSNNNKQIAIEVFHTHESEETKKHLLKNPWIEVETSTILDNPFVWICYDFRFSLNFCSECTDHFKKVIKYCDIYRIDRRTYTPLNIPYDKHDYFIADIISCYRCNRTIPVFDLENSSCDFAVPHTVKFMRTKREPRGYITNTCGHCGAIIGNFYVRTETRNIGSNPDFPYVMRKKWFGVHHVRLKQLENARFKLMKG